MSLAPPHVASLAPHVPAEPFEAVLRERIAIRPMGVERITMGLHEDGERRLGALRTVLGR